MAAAVRCSSSSPSSSSSNLNIKNSPLSPTNTNKSVMMVSNATHVSLSTTIKPLFQFTSSIKNKVFEDEANGIFCYRDNNGEIVCEGYDEGPRYQQQEHLTLTECAKYRDAKIVDLLQRSLCQILNQGFDEDASGSTFC